MAAASPNAPKRILFDACGGFADKRVKDLNKGRLFIIDGRTEGDKGAGGELYPWFCQIFAGVVDQDTAKIVMRGAVPEGPLVAKWSAENGARRTGFGQEFTARRGQEERIAGLAAAFLAIVRPGARYPVKSYKYVCPRVVGSLDKVRRVLGEVWAGQP